MKVFLLGLTSALLFCSGEGTPDPAPAGALHNFLPGFLYPPGKMRDPSACTFNGPQDGPTLRGQNFVENHGTGSCLTFRRSQNLAIDMGVCSWNSLPSSNQLFNFNNGNGGSILKTAVSAVFGGDTCVSTSTKFGTGLNGERCSNSGKDSAQTWRFNKIRNNLYQMTQLSSSKCLRVDSTRVGAVPTIVRCNAFDNFQLWRICTSK